MKKTIAKEKGMRLQKLHSIADYQNFVTVHVKSSNQILFGRLLLLFTVRINNIRTTVSKPFFLYIKNIYMCSLNNVSFSIAKKTIVKPKKILKKGALQLNLFHSWRQY